VNNNENYFYNPKVKAVYEKIYNVCKKLLDAAEAAACEVELPKEEPLKSHKTMMPTSTDKIFS